MLTLFILAVLAAIAIYAAFRWRRHELDSVWARVVDFVVRLRNHLLGGFGALLAITPELADLLRELRVDPDFAALVPVHWLQIIGVVLIFIGAFARLRPSSRAGDPDVEAKKAAQAAVAVSGEPAQVMVKPAGAPPIAVATVLPKGAR